MKKYEKEVKDLKESKAVVVEGEDWSGLIKELEKEIAKDKRDER